MPLPRPRPAGSAPRGDLSEGPGGTAPIRQAPQAQGRAGPGPGARGPWPAVRPLEGSILGEFSAIFGPFLAYNRPNLGLESLSLSWAHLRMAVLTPNSADFGPISDHF